MQKLQTILSKTMHHAIYVMMIAYIMIVTPSKSIAFEYNSYVNPVSLPECHVAVKKGESIVLPLVVFFDQETDIESIDIYATFNNNILNIDQVSLIASDLANKDYKLHSQEDNENIALIFYATGNLNSFTETVTIAYLNLTAIDNGIATLSITDSECNDQAVTAGFLVNNQNCQSTNIHSISPPHISKISDLQILEDGTSEPISLTIFDEDTDYSDLTLSAFSSNTDILPNEKIEFSGTPKEPIMSISPSANMNGRLSITIIVSDPDGLTASTEFEFNVIAVNDAPVIGKISDQETFEDDPLFDISFSINDTESAVHELTVTGRSSNQEIVSNDNIAFDLKENSQTIHIKPTENKNGQVIITIIVADPEGLTTITELELTVVAVNDAPVIGKISDQKIFEDEPLFDISFSINDTESAVQELTVTGCSSNQEIVSNDNIVFDLKEDYQTIYIKLTKNMYGQVTITIIVSDPEGLTASTEFDLTVVSVNDAPVIGKISDQEIFEDDPLFGISFSINDTESAVQELTVTGCSSKQEIVSNDNIGFTLKENSQTIYIQPTENMYGKVIITIIVSDPEGLTASTEFKFNVIAVNDAPVIGKISDHETFEDKPLFDISFSINDTESAVQELTVTACSSNQEIVSNDNITFDLKENVQTIHIKTTANMNGTLSITIIVSDPESLTASTEFELTVKELINVDFNKNGTIDLDDFIIAAQVLVDIQSNRNITVGIKEMIYILNQISQ